MYCLPSSLLLDNNVRCLLCLLHVKNEIFSNNDRNEPISAYKIINV